MATVYELPAPYWRAWHDLLREERELRPEWAGTIAVLADPPGKLARWDAELAPADLVVVPSRLVAESLSAAPVRPPRIEVVPDGCPPPAPGPVAERRPGEPLRVLFAG